MLARLLFSSSKYRSYCRHPKLPSRIALCYYPVIRDCHFDVSVSSNVMSRAVTEQIVSQSRRLVEFTVSKWLKLTQFHLFTSLFD